MRISLADFRIASRALIRRPGLSATVITTLGVATALVGAVFAIINAAYYRPASYAGADRIVALTAYPPSGRVSWSRMPLEAAEAVRAAHQSLENVAVFSERLHTARFADGAVTRISATAIDSAVVPLVAPAIQAGRHISPADIVARNAVAVISDSLWRAQFDSTPDLRGRALWLDGQPFAVIGVLAPAIRFYERSHALIPLHETRETTAPDSAQQFSVLAKLRPGRNVQAARAELAAIQQRLASGDTRFRGWRLHAQDSMFDHRTGLPPQQYLWGLLIATVAVLLVACTNVSNLLLVRAVERGPETTVRASLGASKFELAKQGLLENGLLALVSSVLGLLLTALLVSGVARWFASIGFRPWTQWAPSATSVLFAFAAGCAVLAAIGLAPLRVVAKADLMSILRQSGGAIVGRRMVARRGQRGIILMIAVSLALTANAVLMWRSYFAASHTDLGYDATRVMSFGVLREASFTDEGASAGFYRALVDELNRDARVGAAALRGNARRFRTGDERQSRDLFGTRITDEGGQHGIRAEYLSVSDAYFVVIGVRLIAGQGLIDLAVEPPVAVVSASTAMALWRDLPPVAIVGRSFRAGNNGPLVTVVGVAADVKAMTRTREGLSAEVRPIVYFSERQVEASGARLLVRAANEHAPIAVAVRESALRVDPDAAVGAPRSMFDLQMGEAMMLTRGIGTFIAVLSIAALALGLLGIYTVVAYSVSQRKPELGLRLALGATPSSLRRFLVMENMRPIALAIVVGLGLCVAASRLVRMFVVGVEPLEPLVLGAIAMVVLLFSVAACYFPTARPTNLSPMRALRGN